MTDTEAILSGQDHRETLTSILLLLYLVAFVVVFSNPPSTGFFQSGIYQSDDIKVEDHRLIYVHQLKGQMLRSVRTISPKSNNTYVIQLPNQLCVECDLDWYGFKLSERSQQLLGVKHLYILTRNPLSLFGSLLACLLPAVILGVLWRRLRRERLAYEN